MTTSDGVTNTVRNYKILFIIGIITSFVSLFLNWFQVSITNLDGQVLFKDSFSFIFGWSTPQGTLNPLLNKYYPIRFSIPNLLTITYLILIAGSVFIVLFRNIEKSRDFERSKYNAYFLLALCLMISLVLIIFPTYYLLPNGLFFPGVMFEDIVLEVNVTHQVGIGYYGQAVSFTFMIPHSLFCYQTSKWFEMEIKDPIRQKQSQIEELEHSLDIRGIIADEEAILAKSHSRRKK
jgi:hypothetical protein